MPIKVNFDDCIGCGVCAELSPDNFKLDEDEGKTTVINAEASPSAKEAADSCPVSAITAD
ncbi:MAG: ferredoxin [Synergistes jonesii]|uniref:ferredoxin n=1 Tax=Synergistes jonesii TaxID=2754 RepID=UPI002A75D5FA|nr:ferredoxin [Synergistes jonesii]MDY2984076.1 ferredoxin [Synergistes jonesii]